MRRVISISQIIAPFRAQDGPWEVWASADANYNEATSQLEVRLDSFLRRSRDDKRLTMDWLPKSQTVLSTVAVEEGVTLAKKIFEEWVSGLSRTVQSEAKSRQSGKAALAE